MRTVDVLAAQTDEAYGELRDRLEGTTQDELFWEPVEDCWTVRRLADGRWYSDYEEPDPVPAPFTTLAWRVAHVATCKIMYHEYAFGPGRLRFDTFDHPHTVDGGLAMLEEGQELLLADLRALEDEEMESPRMTNWGEEWPAWRIFWTMIGHDQHHGGEIGALRDLYRIRMLS